MPKVVWEMNLKKRAVVGKKYVTRAKPSREARKSTRSKSRWSNRNCPPTARARALRRPWTTRAPDGARRLCDLV